MKQIEFNTEKLKAEEVEAVTKKVRALVINKHTQKALLVRYAGLYMLPGGSVDEGETEVETLKREVLEEAGIEITEEQLRPYLLINSYDRNYVDRKKGTINRLTKTIFYEVSTDKEMDETKKNLTESEKENNYTIEYTNLSVMHYLIETNKTDNPKRKQFDREILTALNEFAQMKEIDKNERER